MVKGWLTVTLGEMARDRNVVIQTGPFGTVLSASEFVKYGTPVISVREIRDGYIKIYPETPCVEGKTTIRLPDYILLPDDLVIARKGSVERCALVSKTIKQFFLGSDAIRVRVISSKIEPSFLFYYFHSSAVKNVLIQGAYGTTMAGLNETILSSIPVSYPQDLREQHRIVEALSDTDALIAAMEALIAKKRAIKQGAMQELLTGKRRLPGFDGDWVEKTVDGCLAEIIGGGTPSRSCLAFWNGNIPWVTVKDFATFNSLSTQEYISDFGLYNSATHLIPKGTPITATRMGLGQIVVYDIDVTINQDLKALKLNGLTDTCFFVFWFRSKKADFETLGTGSTVKGITLEQLREFPIMLPPTITEQTAIAEILSDMDAEIDALTAKLNKLRNIKQGMMFELLTGRIRLMDEDEKTEVVAKPVPIMRVLPDVKPKGHNKAIEDAIILAVVVDLYATEQYPLTPFYAQKFPYLLYRHMEGVVQGYHKLAAGPYNAELKYKTALPIAKKNGYVITRIEKYKGKSYQAMLAGDNIEQAKRYFVQWHGDEPLKWLEQFRYIKNRRDELELLTTVDMAMEELRESGVAISVQGVKIVIQASEEWRAKLKREIFSDVNIARAIEWSKKLFVTE